MVGNKDHLATFNYGVVGTADGVMLCYLSIIYANRPVSPIIVSKSYFWLGGHCKPSSPFQALSSET
ncbi:hypothetical protein BDR07DRAFT_1410157 [Suillus spraguei]|nr:hypothetical protein BDR07DRAFT_1410157 [Suillus spraguei]